MTWHVEVSVCDPCDLEYMTVVLSATSWEGVGGAGIRRDGGASLQCLDTGSNNLLRNVCSRHSDAVVVSIISADPSSHPPSPPQLRTLNGIHFGPHQ